jgi:hypothetical protein
MITIQGSIQFPEEANVDNIELNKNNILNIEVQEIDRSDVELPLWGIVSNDGTLTIKDLRGNIKNLSRQKKLKGKIVVNLELVNTLVSDCKTSIGNFFAQNWDYDDNNRSVTVSLSDGLVEWQNINVKLDVDLTRGAYSENAYDLISNVLRETGNLGEEEELPCDDTTTNHLANISIPIPSYEGTLWSVLQNFCEAFQIRIYKNRSGQIVLKYNGEH